MACCGGSPSRQSPTPPVVPFSETLQTLWRRPLEATPFYKDLPRLCRRLVVKNTRKGEVQTWGDDEGSTVDIMAHILLYMVEELEPPSRLDEVRPRVLAVAHKHRTSQDLEAVTPLLVEAVGEESPALRVLKLINQNVILAAVECLHDTVCKGLLTKDVRSKDGWRLVIEIDQSRVQLYHIRREQSLDLTGMSSSSDRYEFEYEVVCTFDRGGNLTSGSLRITRLDLSPTMAESKKALLRHTLLGDVIIC